jgi:hypothetical protein
MGLPIRQVDLPSSSFFLAQISPPHLWSSVVVAVTVILS